MKRRRQIPEEAKLSLFPFLDVLLCTMGTLIILLIVITSQAWRTAKAAATQPKEVETTNPDDNPEAWQKRVAQLESAHGDVADAVKQRRVELGYLEQNTRKLQMRMAELQATLIERKRLNEAKSESVEQAADEVKHLEARIAEAQKDLDALLKEGKEKPASYSIIPYEGPNKTPRRPVYIECRAKDVVLQPEGIVLSSDDFVVSTDPGNPLVTVLRATREYFADGKSLTAEQEPYPLIIVRPDGVEAYYAVRQSLQGWATDFGYEMVDRDWKLKFPTPDPNLAVAQNQALAEARLRQKGLIAMIARRSKRGPKYSTAAGSGIVREGDGGGGAGIPFHGGSGDEEEDNGFGTPGFAANQTGGGDGGSSGGENGLAGGPSGSAHTGANGTANGSGTRTGAGGTGAGTGTGTGSAAKALAGGQPGGTHVAGGRGASGGKGGTSTAGQTGEDLRYGDASTQPGGNGQGAGATGDPNQTGAGNSKFAQNNAAGTKPIGAAQAQPGAYGGASRPGGNASAGAGGESGSPGGGDPYSSGSGGGGYTGGTPDVDGRDNKSKPNPNSVAKARGRDWALQYAEPTATPVTRPMRVMCYADRLVIVTGDAQRGNKEVILKAATRDSVDEFVSNVWVEIKTWGIAGKGMYWKPILSFDVQEGGEARYEEFRKLFDGSGFDVRRRAPNVARATNTTTRYR